MTGSGGPDTGLIDAWIAAREEPARSRLETLAALVRASAPEAEERVAYGLPTWRLGENLVHLGAFARHIGLYPGPEAIVAFKERLTGLRTSKGAIQLPHDAALPLALVEEIVRWRVTAVRQKATPQGEN